MTSLAKVPSLTPKQAAFVAEYLIDLNATQAAIRAGYSAKTADVQGPRLLGNVRIAAALAAAQTKRTERTEITQDWVLQKARENADAAAAAQNYAAVNGALALIAKHTGGFTDRVDHTTGGQPLPPTQIAIALVRPRE